MQFLASKLVPRSLTGTQKRVYFRLERDLLYLHMSFLNPLKQGIGNVIINKITVMQADKELILGKKEKTL
jgi:hypothetical protein